MDLKEKKTNKNNQHQNPTVLQLNRFVFIIKFFDFLYFT